MESNSPATVNPEYTKTLLDYSGISESGRVRTINQDSYFVGEIPSRGLLALVADGMGGHKTGEVASRKAVEIIREELEQASSHPPGALARAVQAANLEIYDYAREHDEHSGMGTTLTAVFIDDQVGLVGHIGDSRAYLIRDNTIHQLTQDHSWVAERVRQGILSEKEAKHHRWRNVITNALGATQEFKLDLRHFDVRRGDKLLLCSDGISMLIPDETLLEIIDRHPPEEATETLMALANERGSPDNITAVVLQVEHVEAKPKKYALPENTLPEGASIRISDTMGGIRQVEEAYPIQDRLAKLRKKAWYPYRFWILGCLYLILLILFFTLR